MKTDKPLVFTKTLTVRRWLAIFNREIDRITKRPKLILLKGGKP